MYTPPTTEILDALENVIGVESLLRATDFPDVELETVRQALESGAIFVRESISPFAAELDIEGCALIDGRVTTPARFHKIWKSYVDGGWVALSMGRDYGGHGFPSLLQVAFSEMTCGASIAVSMLPLLMRGAAEVLARKGPSALKEKYLSKIVDGSWGATIAMTEPDAGSDIGSARTKALQRADGSWAVSGTKMFITFGDQDLTEGIMHIVLARTGGNGPGGLSLFAVPVDHAEKNDKSVVVTRIEHKLGLNASPTCQVSFDAATGYLLGELNEGLKTIFIMVNGMRLEVAVHGVAVASAATQAALEYASTRIQGTHEGKPAVIAQHPDVRRNLLTMRTMTEGARILVYETARLLDLSRFGLDQQQRRDAADLVALLLPICKAGCSDMSVDVSGLAIQVCGGHGYIRDLGIERLYRDARILPIYEGANGIQAIDLLMRKHAPNKGSVLERLLSRMRNDLALVRSNGRGFAALDVFENSISECQSLSSWILDRVADDPNTALAAATPFLQILFRVAVGWSWVRKLQNSKEEYEIQKVLCEFYCSQVLPQTNALRLMMTNSTSGWTNMPVETLCAKYF